MPSGGEGGSAEGGGRLGRLRGLCEKGSWEDAAEEAAGALEEAAAAPGPGGGEALLAAICKVLSSSGALPHLAWELLHPLLACAPGGGLVAPPAAACVHAMAAEGNPREMFTLMSEALRVHACAGEGGAATGVLAEALAVALGRIPRRREAFLRELKPLLLDLAARPGGWGPRNAVRFACDAGSAASIASLRACGGGGGAFVSALAELALQLYGASCGGVLDGRAAAAVGGAAGGAAGGVAGAGAAWGEGGAVARELLGLLGRLGVVGLGHAALRPPPPEEGEAAGGSDGGSDSGSGSGSEEGGGGGGGGRLWELGAALVVHTWLCAPEHFCPLPPQDTGPRAAMAAAARHASVLLARASDAGAAAQAAAGDGGEDEEMPDAGGESGAGGGAGGPGGGEEAAAALASKGIALAAAAAAHAAQAGGIADVDEALASLMSNLAMMMLVCPVPAVRTAAHGALEATLGAVAPPARLAALERLLGTVGEQYPPVAAVLLQRAKQEAAASWPPPPPGTGAGAGGGFMLAPLPPFAGPRVLRLAEGLLDREWEEEDGEEVAATADGLVAALNLHRFLLLRERAGRTNFTGVRDAGRLQAARGWLPALLGAAGAGLRGLGAAAGGGEQRQRMAVWTLEEVASRVQELVEEEAGGPPPPMTVG